MQRLIMLKLIIPWPAPRALDVTFTSTCVNWGNTLRLFEDIEPNATSAFDVYGFEANPLIQPFADAYVQWLNGDRTDEPEPCVPRSGSSKHLSLYAPYYGCPTACTSLVGCPNWRAAEDKMRSCMRSKLANHIAALRPEPRLNSSALVQSRLARARMPLDSSCAAPLNRSRFTLIPAAAGGPGDPNQMLLEFNRLATITGGGLGGAVEDSYLVNVVDVVEWIGSSFDKRDHIILKMDIEGAEHSILNAMVQGLLQLIDVLSLECHEPSGGHHACEHLISAIGRAAPKLQLLKEGRQHNGVDARSVIEPEEQARRVKACDAIDPERFSLSRREEPPHRRRLLNMRHAPRAPPPSSSPPSTAATVHILYCETRPGSLLRSSLARAMFGQRLEPLLLKVPSDDQPWAGTAFDISEDGLVLSNLCAGQKWAGWFMKYSALNEWYANRTRDGITATSNELVMVMIRICSWRIRLHFRRGARGALCSPRIMVSTASSFRRIRIAGQSSAGRTLSTSRRAAQQTCCDGGARSQALEMPIGGARAFSMPALSWAMRTTCTSSLHAFLRCAKRMPTPGETASAFMRTGRRITRMTPSIASPTIASIRICS